jgi:glycosyltransferase involved in cell wall biosynthesis
MPLVSVIMPYHNAAKYLKKSIESILSQSFENFELILVNDGSTDYSNQIAEEFLKLDPRIMHFSHKTNLGVTQSLKKGLAVSSGKYIARMDADDIANQQRFEKQVRFMEANPAVIVCGSNILLIDENDKIIGQRIYPIQNQDIKRQMWIKNVFAHSAVMIQREVLEAHGINYENKFPRAEDYHLWFELLPYGSFANLDETLLKYRLSSQSIKSVFSKLMLKDTLRLKNYYRLKYGNANMHWRAWVRFGLEIILLAFPAWLIIRIFLLTEIKKRDVCDGQG